MLCVNHLQITTYSSKTQILFIAIFSCFQLVQLAELLFNVFALESRHQKYLLAQRLWHSLCEKVVKQVWTKM